MRVLMVTHVKELIQQNMEKLLRVWLDAPVGVYSAGLKSRETHASILFCGIQSIWNKAGQLSDFDRPIELVFIDEAHRVPCTNPAPTAVYCATWKPSIQICASSA